MEVFTIMNITFPSLIYLVIFLGYVEEIIATESVFFEETEKTPLVLIRENNRCTPAVPQQPKKKSLKDYVKFSYDPATYGQSLVLACPPGSFTEAAKRIKFLNSDFKNKIKNKNVLYEETYNREKENECPSKFFPSVEKKESETSTCFHFHYGAGYWIWNEKTKDTEHVPIYNICYSQTGSVVYTVHTIDALELLSNKKYFQIDGYKLYPSNLAQQSENQDANKNRKHQFVPALDQPLYTWQLTTMIPMNFINVTETIQKYLQNVDYYIRGSFMLIGKRPIKMYSGMYTVTWEELSKTYYSADDAAAQRSFPGKHYTFVWKVANYHSASRNIDFAIAFITQIEPFDECIQICENVSLDSKWTLLQNPAANECTYTCAVDDYIKNKFELAFLGKQYVFSREITTTEKKKNGRHGNKPAGGDDASVTQQNDAATNSDGGGSLAAGLMAFNVAVQMEMLFDDAGQDAGDGHDGGGGADGPGADG